MIAFIIGVIVGLVAGVSIGVCVMALISINNDRKE